MVEGGYSLFPTRIDGALKLNPENTQYLLRTKTSVSPNILIALLR
jgi:hypothetical protein